MSNLTPRINKLDRNLMIDGGMEIWPEGTSRNITNNNRLYGSVLQSVSNNNSGITLTNSRQSSIPSGTNLVSSNQISKTASGTLSATTAILYDYFMEGFDVSDIFNSDFSVIFWVKSSIASLRSVSTRSTTGSHSVVKQYQINQANTWEMKVLKFPSLSQCPGTISRDNSIGTSIRFGVVLGSTYQTATLNQWVSGDFLSGVGEDTTWLTGTNHDFSITGVMVLPGDYTSLTSSGYSFNRAGLSYQEELQKTYRYYERLEAPSQYGFFGTVGAAGTTGSGMWTYKATKRAIPTLGSIGPINLSLRNVGAITPSAFSVGLVNTNVYYAEFNFGAAQTVGTPLILSAGTLTADARF